MAITEIARALTLKYTPVGESQQTVSDIRNYTYSRKGVELIDSKKGTARVKTRYKGDDDATIMVETADIAAWTAISKGDKATDVILELEAAVESHGVAAGGGFKITLSNAVVSEVGDLSHSNEGSDPVVGSFTFQLDRHSSLSEDPTVTEEEVTA